MVTASQDQNFKEELAAIEQWFRVLSDAERTSALYSLLGQATQVQIRFLIMVLQQKAQQDPLSDILSPANFNKDVMNEKMSQAVPIPSTVPTALPNSPGLFRQTHARGPDSAAIQQMFPDAAAALASQRAELNRKKNGQIMAGTAPSSLSQSTIHLAPKDENQRTPWTPSFRKTFEAPTRPKSAEPTNSSMLRNSLQGTPLRSPRSDLNATSAPYSPFESASGNGGQNWASMTNTPASAMFPQSLSSIGSLQQRLAASGVPRASSSVVSNSPKIVLENDATKFRRSSRTPSNTEHTSLFPSSPIMMYDENGQLMSVQATEALTSSINGRFTQPPLIATPGQNGSWQLLNTGSSPFVYPSSSPVVNMDGGYHSDNSTNRRRTPVPKPVENPADPQLLSDVSAWLRQLRLHKYTDNMAGMTWQQMVKMSDSDLEAKGVTALGARRKLMKAFETVNQAIADGTLKE